MKTTNQPIIAVVGATGAQGGGLARAILADPKKRSRLRAVTRDPRSAGARALERIGADVVAADLDEPDSLVRAFEGADAAFCVTFYWAHMDPEREIAQAQHLARAASQARLGHVIWSTLEDTRTFIPLGDDRMPTLLGKYKVPHYDTKGSCDRFFAELGVPTTYLRTSFYWDNFIHFGLGPKRDADGVLAITFPLGDARLPGIAAEDIGKCALGIFSRGEAMLGKTVGIAGGHPTGREMASALTQALGETVRYNDVSPDVYRSFEFPGADDLGNMFQFKRDFEAAYCGARDLGATRELNPELQTLEQWLARNASKIPLG